MGFLIGFSGLEDPSIDHVERKVSAPLNLPPDFERTIRLEILAPRDSGGDALTVSVHLAHYPSGAEHWDHKTIAIETGVPDSGVRVAGFRIAPAGLWVLGWIAPSFLIWVFVRIRTGGRPASDTGWRSLAGPGAAASALSVPIGFWMIFAGMAWRDYEALKVWPETTATIMGRGDRSNTVTSGLTSNSGSGTVHAQSEVITPEFALRYSVGGRVLHSSGYDTGSSIRVGGRVRREAEIREWIPGAAIPCWYNPRDPLDVVVRRGFSGAYIFTLIPLPVFWIGLSMLKSGKPREE